MATRQTADMRRSRLRILATSDVHAHLNAYDYFRDKANDAVGLVRTASLIARARAEAGACILLDNGDFLQGTPMADFIACERGVRDAPHPVIVAMNALGFDAATLGNHEFDYGLDFLNDSLADARFEVVLANLATRLGARPEKDRTFVQPWTILERSLVLDDGTTAPLRIGVIGFTPPQVLQWNRHGLAGRVLTRGVLESARAWVPQLRQAGADVVVALSHGGLGPDIAAAEREDAENASAALAALPGIDAVVAGHVHQVFPPAPGADTPAVRGDAAGCLYGTPVVMPGLWGSHLGVIDLDLERIGDGWRVAAGRSQARPIAQRDGETVRPCIDPDARLSRIVAPSHSETLAYAARPVGRVSRPLSSYFAAIGWDTATAATQKAQQRYILSRLAGTPYAELPLLSAGSAFKSGGRGGPENFTDIAAGGLAIRDLADLYVFPNTAVVLRITGAELRDWLERAASVFAQVRAGDCGAQLLNPECPGYLLDTMAGVDYAIDLTAPARFDPQGRLRDPQATRIRDLRHAGRPVRPEALFLVAANSYRAMGGGRFPGTGEARMVLDTREGVRSLLARFLSEGGMETEPTRPHFRFVAHPGTTIRFDTGPGALAHVDSVPLPGLTHLGPTPEGFARFELALDDHGVT